MITKISRKDFLQKFPDFPQVSYYRNKYHHPDSYASYILTVDAKSTIGLCNNLSSELLKLIQFLNYNELLVLGDTITPWLFRDHDYKPVKKALNYLIEHKVSKNFNGGLRVNIENLNEFTKQLFWLVRCNGIVFIPHFCDIGFNIVINLCQYGNIHLSTITEKADLAFNNALKQTALHISDGSECSGKIFKRQATYIPY